MKVTQNGVYLIGDKSQRITIEHYMFPQIFQVDKANVIGLNIYLQVKMKVILSQMKILSYLL